MHESKPVVKHSVAFSFNSWRFMVERSYLTRCTACARCHWISNWYMHGVLQIHERGPRYMSIQSNIPNLLVVLLLGGLNRLVPRHERLDPVPLHRRRYVPFLLKKCVHKQTRDVSVVAEARSKATHTDWIARLVCRGSGLGDAHCSRNFIVINLKLVPMNVKSHNPINRPVFANRICCIPTQFIVNIG